MKKFITYILLGIFVSLSLTSCFDEEIYPDTQAGNFEALWKIMDEHYCFFDYKNVDWDSIHTAYAARISESMGDEALFTVLGEMLGELKDGHVNLSAAHDLARYWSWKENYPENFDEKTQKNYLGTDYYITGGLEYKILDDNIGYIYYESFSDAFGESNLDQIISKMSICKGIIIDIRNNGGGELSNVNKLACRFFDKKTLVGYMRHKTATGHNDFSDPYAIYIEPSTRINYLEKPVAVLTNRSCFSAANDFVNTMHYAKNVFIVGDSTGGGSGLPFSSELPNGWMVRYSSSPMTNADDKQIEFGIAPDYKIDMTDGDKGNGLDTIIEKARALINAMY